MREIPTYTKKGSISMLPQHFFYSGLAQPLCSRGERFSSKCLLIINNTTCHSRGVKYQVLVFTAE